MLTHNTHYSTFADRSYPVIFTRLPDGTIKKSFLPNVSVPVSFNGVASQLKVFYFVTDTFDGWLYVKCAYNVFFYTISNFSCDLRSIGFPSLDDCLNAVFDFFESHHYDFKEM